MEIETTTVEITDAMIDEFAPMIGADENPIEEQPSVFTKEKDEASQTLDELTNPTEVEDVLSEVDKIDEKTVEEKTEKNKTPKTPKVKTSDNTVSVFKSLIEDKTLLPFDDEKPLEEYEPTELIELIKANIEDKGTQLREQAHKELIESFPDKMKIAARYVAAGGTDMEGLFASLAQTEKIASLDINNEDHHEHIARQYLYATEFGDDKMIEEQIEEWKDSNLLSKKAQVMKPKLDKMNEAILEENVRKQEDIKKQQLQKKEIYMKNIFETLKPGKINDIDISKEKRDYLWEELSKSKHKSINGRNTNLLGKLIEQYQFGENPRYDLIVEATMLLDNPEEYRAAIIQKGKNASTAEITKKLKTEQDRKEKGELHNEELENKEPGVRKLNKPRNIFDRN